ncbi:hypothetical protein BT1A1_1386 [Caldibacillus thermoamylovorans]|uniref:Uncharacterized protein n=1 Tax=Caldibacillus thermoamylovorans TaxID=35841 RepID=A0A090IT12_9BACI|nr:hypothetical protein BT1A1_1386 [Caldibacillus thermoamylovorans]
MIFWYKNRCMSKNNGIGRKNYWKMNGIFLCLFKLFWSTTLSIISKKNVIEVVIPTRFEPATPTLSMKALKLDVFQNILKNHYLSVILINYFRCRTGYFRFSETFSPAFHPNFRKMHKKGRKEDKQKRHKP